MIYLLKVKLVLASLCFGQLSFGDTASIQDILRRDGLEAENKAKSDKKKAGELRKLEKLKKNYGIPSQREFWRIMTYWWLSKNASLLQWDVKRPDWGIEQSFQSLLEKLGHFPVTFRIIIADSPKVPHMGLPSGEGEYIFILSRPFIEKLALNKLEISLLLYQDFFRLKAGQFEAKVLKSNPELKSLWGTSFYKKTPPGKLLHKTLKEYSKIALDSGFTFEEHHKVTRVLGQHLKSNLKLWGKYYALIQKIAKLTKENSLYKHYNKLYPAPEMQLRWLRPKGKVL